MPYNPTVPQATDRIADTQAPISTNFSILNQDFGVDHFPYSGSPNQSPDTGNNGYHYKSTFPIASPAQNPTPPATSGVIYPAAPTGSRTFPFWSRDSGTQAYPMIPIKAFAACSVSTGGASCTITQSYNITAGTNTGIVYNSVGQYTVNFTTALVSSNYLVLLTANRNSTTTIHCMQYNTQTTGSFKVVNFGIPTSASPALKDPDGFSVIIIEV